MKTYLVTGGAGFIGSNFILYMLEKYGNSICIINLDKLTYAGNLENLKETEKNPNYKFIKADICDRLALQQIFSGHDIDYVVNFAAESHVDRSIRDPEVFVKTNVLGTHALLDTAKMFWQTGDQWAAGKKFIQISTDEVYGSLGGAGYFTEKTPLDPHSPYSASKTGADLLVKAYYDTFRLPINITRCSNNYGPFQFPEKLIPLVINNCLSGKPIPVYGDGKNVRDWLYVRDHCRAIDLVIGRGKTGEIYNIGGHNERTNIDIVKIIINTLQRIMAETDGTADHINEGLIRYVEDRKGHDRRYAIDPAKIKGELGWVPDTGFESGIAQTISWYLHSQEWLNRVTSGNYQNYYSEMYTNKLV